MNFNIFEGTSIIFKLLALIVLTALIQVLVFEGQEDKTFLSALIGGAIIFLPRLIFEIFKGGLSLLLFIVEQIIHIIGNILQAFIHALSGRRN